MGASNLLSSSQPGRSLNFKTSLELATRDPQGQHMSDFRAAATSLSVRLLELVSAPKNKQAARMGITLLPVCEGSAVELVCELSGAWRIPLGESRWLQEIPTGQPGILASSAAERQNFLGSVCADL